MYSFLLMTLIASVTVTGLVTGKKSVACYGIGDCNLAQLQCTDEDVVQLTDLQYGYKTTRECQNSSTVCDASSPTCCKDEKMDCKHVFTNTHKTDTYEKCSGRHWNCSIQAPQANIDCHGESSESSKTQVLSTYAIMSYTCVKKSKIQFQCKTCEIEGPEVHLLLTDLSECLGLSCIAMSSHNLSLTAVDIRLQRLDGNCSSTRLSANNTSLDCEEDNFLNNFRALKETNGVRRAEINISNVLFDRPSMIWIKLTASENVMLSCKRIGKPPFSTTAADANVSNAPAAHTPDEWDPIPIVVSVIIIVVLLAAVAAIAVFLWRKRKCLQKPNSEIHGHQQLTQNALLATSVPPVNSNFELEPPEVMGSTYVDIPKDNRQQEDENPALSEYDKLGMKRKIAVPTETVNNIYSHVNIDEDQTPYSHIGKMGHGKGVNRKPLSEYSHVQLAQGFRDCTGNQRDSSEYSHLANCRRGGRTEAGETEQDEHKYTYDRKERNINLDESDTYSHLQPSKS